MNDARVNLWGRQIGAVSWLEDREISVFQFLPEFVESGIQLAPLMMPLVNFPFEFPGLARDAFRGLPGLLADSLPDKFGNALIDVWLAAQGRTAASFHPVERLCYTGTRGMGALEYEPAILEPTSQSKELEVANLVKLANIILDERKKTHGVLGGEDDQEILGDILRVGTSAGGARAKAVLAWNPVTNEFQSGQIKAGSGFEYWLLKFDGISNNRDKEMADPQGYGLIEFAYYQLAVKAGIEMNPCRLHKEGGRSHFMTRRFDRLDGGGKVHMQSLGAIAHFDYNQPASYSYEQALQTMKRLELSRVQLEQQVLRAMFNVVGRNQDDHVKNIAFLMNRRGDWRLSPAFDVTYAYDPLGDWTSQHQMSINGKRDGFNQEDLIALGRIAGMKPARTRETLGQVLDSFQKWPDIAGEAGIAGERIKQIQSSFRQNI